MRRAGTRRARHALSAPRIVSVAVQEADERGLRSLTVRRLAERLSVSAGALYAYVPSKSELIRAMVRSVFPPLPCEATPATRARAAIRLARAMAKTCARHPWLCSAEVAGDILLLSQAELSFTNVLYSGGRPAGSEAMAAAAVTYAICCHAVDHPYGEPVFPLHEQPVIRCLEAALHAVVDELRSEVGDVRRTRGISAGMSSSC